MPGGGNNYSNGALATNANLTDPLGVAVDAAGNIYIALNDPCKIRKVNSAGYIFTIAGTGLNYFGGDGGPAVDAYLDGPRSVSVDLAGNVYFADYWNYRTRKINTAGIITTIAGNGFQTYNGDGGLADTTSTGYNSGVKVDPSSGKVYITDTWHNHVRVVDTSGFINEIAGSGYNGCSGDGGPALSATFEGATNCAIDAAGNIYVVDFNCNTVRKIDVSGKINAFAGSGIAGFSGDGGPATSARLNFPNDVVADNAGNVYICDAANHRVRKVDASGIITTVAGNGVLGFSGDSGAAVSAQLNFPRAVAVDVDGNLFIADRNDRIRKVTMGACNAYFYLFPDTTVAGFYYGENLATGNNLSYLWDFGDGNTSTQSHPSHTYAVAGQYYVCLTIDNGNGCIASYCDSSFLVFKTQNGLMSQLNILGGTTPVVEVKPGELNFSLFPNPATTAFTISIDESILVSTVSITDITGRKMTAADLPTINHQLADLVNGVYFVTVTANNGRSAIKKLIIRK